MGSIVQQANTRGIDGDGAGGRQAALREKGRGRPGHLEVVARDGAQITHGADPALQAIGRARRRIGLDMLGTHQHAPPGPARARRRRGQSGKAPSTRSGAATRPGSNVDSPTNSATARHAGRSTTRAARRSAADDRPSTATRSAMASASSWSWVTSSVVAPKPLQGANLVAQIGAHIGVQGRERLVQQQGAGIDGQRARQRDPLLLAPGQLGDGACGMLGQADQLQQLAGAALARHRPCAAPCRRPRCPPPTDAETRHSSGTPCRCRAGAPACPPDPVHSAGCCPHAGLQAGHQRAGWICRSRWGRSRPAAHPCRPASKCHARPAPWITIIDGVKDQAHWDPRRRKDDSKAATLARISSTTVAAQANPVAP